MNAALPSVWMVYIMIADLDACMARCRELGGKVAAGPTSMGQDRYCVIEDPAGAVCRLYQSGASASA